MTVTIIFVVFVVASVVVLALATTFLFAWVGQLERGLQDAHARSRQLEEQVGITDSKSYSRRRDD